MNTYHAPSLPASVQPYLHHRTAAKLQRTSHDIMTSHAAKVFDSRHFSKQSIYLNEQRRRVGVDTTINGVFFTGTAPVNFLRGERRSPTPPLSITAASLLRSRSMELGRSLRPLADSQI